MSIDFDVQFEELNSSFNVNMGEAVETGNHANLTNLDYEHSGHTGFVQAVEGKGLSENDYSDEEKQKVTDSYNSKHTHSNKSILDGITQALIDTWNTVTGKYTKPQTGIPKTDLASDVQTSLGKADTAIQEHQSLSAYRTSANQDVIDEGKVDKVQGKGLSTNDYTNAEKTKLSGIEAGAEVNVQANWNQTDTSVDDYIKNKPTNVSAFTNDVGYLTEHQSLANYDTKSEVNTKISNATNDMATQTWVEGKGYGTYSKPSGGIPKTDLTSTVQTSLGLADTALQEHQSLAAYRTATAQDTIDATKVGKVSNPVTGNFAELTSTGEISDSDFSMEVVSTVGQTSPQDIAVVQTTGQSTVNVMSQKAVTDELNTKLTSSALTPYRTSAEQDAIDNSKADVATTYTKTEVDTALLAKEDITNKVTTWSATPSATKYPTEALVANRFEPLEALGLYRDADGYICERS